MNIYSKRVGFVIAEQHVIPHGGIGQFLLGFARLCQGNAKLDIIVDRRVADSEFVLRLKELGASFVWPSEHASYKDHQGTFCFSESINFEKMQNFRDSIMLALESNLYDLFVVNSFEAFPAIYALNIQTQIPIVFYTHNESMVFRDNRTLRNVFNDSYNEFFNKMLELKDIVVGTQSDRNHDELVKHGIHDVRVLPMPMPEATLLEPWAGEKEGVLFIGRWEKGKNPDAFIRVIKETGLPAKVLTNKNGAAKFRQAFAENGIENYQIAEGVIGQEKVDFIRSSRVHFNPSLREAYCFAMFECIGHMPCVVLDKAAWAENFPLTHYRDTGLAQAASVVLEEYNNPANIRSSSARLKWVRYQNNESIALWNVMFRAIDMLPNKKSLGGKIQEHKEVMYREFIKSLNRTKVSVEDIQTVLNNRDRYVIMYTDTDTFLLDPNSVESSENAIARMSAPSSASLDTLFE